MRTLLFILAYDVAIITISALSLGVFRQIKMGVARPKNFAFIFYFLPVIIVAIALIVKLHLE